MTNQTQQNSIQLEYLNPSLVIENRLCGWQLWVWMLWGQRTYLRNTNESGYAFAGLVVIPLFMMGAFLFFNYVPFKFIGAIIFIGVTGTSLFWPIVYANRSLFIGWSHLLIGSLGITQHWQWGLLVFHHSIANYVFLAYVVSGLLAGYRRAWNNFIWKALDHITYQYYLREGLDFTRDTLLIEDYKTAYQRLYETFHQFLETSTSLPPDQCQELYNLLKQHILAGLDRALHLLELEAKK